MPSSRKSSQPKGRRQILLALSHLGSHIYTHVGFPRATTGKEPTCHCRRHKRCEFHLQEERMATHNSVLAWRIPGTGEPGGLPSLGSHRVGHDWSDLAAAGAFIYTMCVYIYTHCVYRMYNQYIYYIHIHTSTHTHTYIYINTHKNLCMYKTCFFFPHLHLS